MEQQQTIAKKFAALQAQRCAVIESMHPKGSTPPQTAEGQRANGNRLRELLAPIDKQIQALREEEQEQGKRELRDQSKEKPTRLPRFEDSEIGVELLAQAGSAVRSLSELRNKRSQLLSSIPNEETLSAARERAGILTELRGLDEQIDNERLKVEAVEVRLRAARLEYAKSIEAMLQGWRDEKARRMHTALERARQHGADLVELESEMRLHGLEVTTLLARELREPAPDNSAASIHGHYQPIMRDARSMAQRVAAFFNARGYN